MNSSQTNQPVQTENYLQLQEKLDSFINDSTKRIKDLENQLSSQRVQIRNFEGLLKIFTTAPDASNFRDGAIIIFDDSGTIQLGINVSGVFYYTTLT